MKILKLIIGTLAVLFVLAHGIELISGLITEGPRTGSFAVSYYGGKIAAICIGIIVAIACFKKKDSNKGIDVTPES